MPRKKRTAAEAAPRQTSAASVAVDRPKEPAAAPAMERPAWIDGPPTTSAGEQNAPAPINEIVPRTDAHAEEPAHGKNWGPPYKAVFTSTEKGFEMGENRRFKQRVFKFKEKPDAETVAILKENGFTYRPEEKAWTIQADAGSRLLSDRLALQFAGQSAERLR